MPETEKVAETDVKDAEMVTEVAETPIETPNLPVQQNYRELIDKAALTDGIDPAVIHSLIDADERVQDRIAKQIFITAKIIMRKDIPTIVKEKFNKHTKSHYADFADIKKKVDPIMEDHDFIDDYNYEYETVDGEVYVWTICTLSHIGGHQENHRARVARDDKGPSGTTNKSKTHGDSSAMSYGQRLSLGAALGIKTAKDDDGNAAGGSVSISKDKIKKINELIEKTGLDTKQFCEEFAHVDSVADIPDHDYRRVLNGLLAKRNEQLEAENENT